YLPAADRVVALDAETGQPIWQHMITGGALSRHGVAYWPGEATLAPRIVFTAGRRLIAVNAKTGERDFGFGTDGTVDLVVPYNSVPLAGNPGHDSWEGDSWKDRLGANAWPFYFTLDEQRGLLYLPLASPIVGPYGGDRKGANLYGNSVVAVDVQTGAYKWHFQTIHHDLWDHDPPAPPALFDITRNGRTVPALGVTTKSGYLYILNRETGQPV